MTIFDRILLNVRVCRTSLVRSLITLICPSTSGACSSVAAILISTLGKSSLIASKLLSPLIKLPTKPNLAYNWITLVIPVTYCDLFLLLMNIDLVYLRRQDNVTRNEREFTYIMSTTMLTWRCK